MLIRNCAITLAAFGTAAWLGAAGPSTVPVPLSVSPPASAVALPSGLDNYNSKQYLTIRDCIRLGLQQNLDIGIQRLNPVIAAADILAAEGIFDVNWRTSMNEARAKRPGGVSSVSSGFVASPAVTARTDVFETGFTGKSPIGTTYDVGMNIQRLDSQGSSGRTLQWSAFTGIELTQPLAKGFGWEVNTFDIRVARKSKDISYMQFVQQVMQTVATIESSYYDIIYDYENVRVKQQSVGLALRFLDESKKRFEVGTMSRLDIVQAEAEVAQREGDLIDAMRTLDLHQAAFKQLISRDVVPLRDALVVPVDRPSVVPRVLNPLDNIRAGLENRPEYMQRRLELERSHIYVKYYRNSLLPGVDLTGSYGFNALSAGNPQNDWTRLDNNMNSIYGAQFPAWAAGVVVTVPLGNDTARGNYRHWKIAVEQALLSLKKTEQDIIVGVDSAAIQVQAKSKLIVSRQAATRLQEETLRAEEEKLKAGTSTTFVVLRIQRDLTDARVNELRAIAAYNPALVALELKDGTILKRAGVAIEAE
ncbi:MAG: TolC family protein [Verrucomicrobia bacterium]|nr:TolC family protein [Verrucomicrobiota bacterium]